MISIWRVGLIVGPSVFGKSSILEHVFGAPVTVRLERAVRDRCDFNRKKTMVEIREACCAVGLKSGFTALRRDQSPSRANLQAVEPFRLPTGKVIRKVSPLADWTHERRVELRQGARHPAAAALRPRLHERRVRTVHLGATHSRTLGRAAGKARSSSAAYTYRRKTPTGPPGTTSAARPWNRRLGMRDLHFELGAAGELTRVPQFDAVASRLGRSADLRHDARLRDDRLEKRAILVAAARGSERESNADRRRDLRQPNRKLAAHTRRKRPRAGACRVDVARKRLRSGGPDRGRVESLRHTSHEFGVGR